MPAVHSGDLSASGNRVSRRSECIEDTGEEQLCDLVAVLNSFVDNSFLLIICLLFFNVALIRS